jgi:membrane-bound lytic murein transglycosylase A
MSKLAATFEPVSFGELAGWEGDDHLDALETFISSCEPVLASAACTVGSAKTERPSPQLLAACRAALSLEGRRLTTAEARGFFEARFRPHRVVHDGPPGLLTGYYEPLLEGARARGGAFQCPVYRRPPDLVNLVAESERGALAHALTHARKTATGHEPYVTRREIEEGALEGRGLELVWLEDPVDTFFMHIQGSGRIALADGSTIRVTYDGKNGHPYTSIGRHLIDAGLFPADRMSLDALKEWLKADVARGREAMWQNKSFVFFRELEEGRADSPLGVLEIPLTMGRSLAVDTAFHAIGTPVYVSAPSLTHAASPDGFRRLMIAQDVGSAIRGPERGDIYFGSGDEAGKLAGVTKHPGTFYVLLAAAKDRS